MTSEALNRLKIAKFGMKKTYVSYSLKQMVQSKVKPKLKVQEPRYEQMQ